ncbi:MAG: thioredoxin family protein [Bacilli bacterium]|nr:thioredoxin family protein [Bacilli bacterium]
MKLIRIGASWCSSCLIMKSRVSDILASRDDIEVINYDYDFDEDKVEEYQVGDVLPVYIKEDGSRLIGEHTKEEFIKFIES